ncbi:MAG: LysE family transporter [Bacteroidales bacterium]
MIFILAILAAIIGAVPLGLVNLSVIETTIHKGHKPAMQIALGAALVEVIFGLIAILSGNILNRLIGNNAFINYMIAGVLLLAGLLFLFIRKSKNIKRQKVKFSGVFKGIFLNLISLQVFLYWLLAATFFYAYGFEFQSSISLILLITGILTGKIIILWLYSLLSKNVLSNMQIVVNHTNKLMGIILLVSGLIHLTRIQF